MTDIRRCNCKHAWQDRRYGKGMRVHNRMPQKSLNRCTVCGNEK